MAITADHPRPVVRGTTGLNSHGAWRKLREELLHRAAPKLATQHNGSRSINSVNLKHVLRQIQTNCANLAHGRLPCLVESTSPVWHTDAVGGRPPHHCERSEAIHREAKHEAGSLRCARDDGGRSITPRVLAPLFPPSLRAQRSNPGSRWPGSPEKPNANSRWLRSPLLLGSLTGSSVCFGARDLPASSDAGGRRPRLVSQISFAAAFPRIH